MDDVALASTQQNIFTNGFDEVVILRRNRNLIKTKTNTTDEHPKKTVGIKYIGSRHDTVVSVMRHFMNESALRKQSNGTADDNK